MVLKIDKKLAEYCFAIIFFALLQACSSKFSNKESDVSASVKLSPRLQILFRKTKLVCFGRYALEVPQEAELIMGRILIPSEIKSISGGAEAKKQKVAMDISEVKRKNKTAEITYNGEGPIRDSWQIRYFRSYNAKTEGLHIFTTYVNLGDLTFIFGDSLNGGTEEATAARQAVVANSLRLRAPDEVPNEPGFCVEHAFVADKLYARQEMTNVGIYLPSLPDVTFSLSSNKDAYSDYSAAEYEKMKREELPLLARIEQAKKDQGINYPSRTLLREGKRDVQHWHGEESLIRRNDGVHDFEWAFVGTPKDVANPSEVNVNMYTKVEHNTIGAAKAASLSDDEAIALWDKLLSGLKFRVKVPGAPEGSYFIPAPKTQEPVGR